MLGMAGPVSNNVVELTNVQHWDPVDGRAIAQTLEIPKVILINDFEAAG